MSNGTNTKKSFWGTLPGILTGITGFIAAVTGLITVLGDNNLIGAETPTPFPTSTPVDIGEILPTPVPATAEPQPLILDPPACINFEVYAGKPNPNAVVLAFTDEVFWVRYGGLEEAVEKTPAITIYQFDTSNPAAACLRQWVQYLTAGHDPNWPLAANDKDRPYDQVWLGSPSPPVAGELVGWEALPENLLVAVVDDQFNPQYVRIFACGDDLPSADRARVVYWHAATSPAALEDYLELYAANGYTNLGILPCGQ